MEDNIHAYVLIHVLTPLPKPAYWPKSRITLVLEPGMRELLKVGQKNMLVRNELDGPMVEERYSARRGHNK